MTNPTPNGDRAAWLYGPGSQCRETGTPPRRAWRLILLGAPGTGKGTQAARLQQYLGACPLSTGEVFRAARKQASEAASPAMQRALAMMETGALVPDSTVIDIVAERDVCLTCPHGFMLDGFPRTLSQAVALDALCKEHGFEIDAVVDYSLPEEEVIRRLSGRRTCPSCGRSFHIDGLGPGPEHTCDACGAVLVQRADDSPESIAVRLAAYHKETSPLTDYYRGRGQLISVSAAGSPDDVFARTLDALGIIPEKI